MATNKAEAVSERAKAARNILGEVQMQDTEIHHLVNAIQVMAFNIGYTNSQIDYDNHESVEDAARTGSETLLAIAQLARQAKEKHGVTVKSGDVQSFLFSLLSSADQAEELR